MMTSRRVLLALMLAAAGAFVACDRTNEVGGPMGPQFAKIKSSPRVLQSSSFSAGLTCSQPISKQGGFLKSANGVITLNISRNAVDHATQFCATATVRNGYDMVVILNAWEPSGTPVHQFQATIKLTIDLSTANVTDWSRVGVAYVAPDGSLDLVPSQVDKVTKTVTAVLNHFSDYSPVEN